MSSGQDKFSIADDSILDHDEDNHERLSISGVVAVAPPAPPSVQIDTSGLSDEELILQFAGSNMSAVSTSSSGSFVNVQSGSVLSSPSASNSSLNSVVNVNSNSNNSDKNELQALADLEKELGLDDMFSGASKPNDDAHVKSSSTTSSAVIVNDDDNLDELEKYLQSLSSI